MPHHSTLARVWKYIAIPLALSTSAGALFTLVAVERGKVHAALAPEPVTEPTDAPGERFLPLSSVHLAHPPVLPASGLAALTPAAATKTEPSDGAATGQVRVPELTGKRLGQARREAKKLGLKLVARDGYGERIPAELGPYYRVRKQSSAPGSSLPAGSTVEVRVRAIESYASGY